MTYSPSRTARRRKGSKYRNELRKLGKYETRKCPACGFKTAVSKNWRTGIYYLETCEFCGSTLDPSESNVRVLENRSNCFHYLAVLLGIANLIVTQKIETAENNRENEVTDSAEWEKYETEHSNPAYRILGYRETHWRKKR